MAADVTLARPYAKAAFDFARERQEIADWQKMLKFASQVVAQKEIAQTFSPKVPQGKLARLIIAIGSDKLDRYAQNFIRIMAYHNRLLLLPEVFQQFIKLCAMTESKIEVEVTSARPLTEGTLSSLIAALERRLACKVTLKCTVDQLILGGLIVRIQDKVIDGSLRDRIDRLAESLQI